MRHAERHGPNNKTARMFYALLGERERKTRKLVIVIRNAVRRLNIRAQRSASDHDVLEPPKQHEGKQLGDGRQSFWGRCMPDAGTGVQT